MTKTDSKQRFRFSRLTDLDISNIKEVLTHGQDTSNKNIEEIIFSIDTACGDAFSREEVGDPSEMRLEITTLLNSIEELLECANKLTLYSLLELEDGYPEVMGEGDSDVAIFEGSGITGEGMWGLRVRLRAAKKLAEQALERIDVPRGAPVKKDARGLAIAIRQAFEEHGISATSYEDGAFMQVLEVAFSALVPDAGVESYIRHGKWALSIHDPDNEIDWGTMRIDWNE